MRWLLTYPEDGPSVAFYARWVRACGAEPVLLDSGYNHPGDLSAYSALLLSGGGDLEPVRYGATSRHPATYDVSQARDALEERLFFEFLALQRPVFGICRGVQLLNVALGGSLLQHVPDVVAEDRERHRQKDSYDVRHPLLVEPSSRLGAALSGASDANSAHHQAIDPARLGRGLQVAAQTPAGVVEALESIDPRARASGVQWHPERLPLEHPASAQLRAHWCEMLGPVD